MKNITVINSLITAIELYKSKTPWGKPTACSSKIE